MIGSTRWLAAFIALLLLSADAVRAAELPPLLEAVKAGNLSAVRELLAHGADIHVRDETRSTALMLAAIYADTPMLSLLLESGVDVNAQNEAGATALMWSVDSPDKVQRLLKHGANVNATGKSGLTPLIMAAVRPTSLEVVRLLLDHGADVNANSNHFSPLMAACWRGDGDVQELLIHHGANPKATNRYGFSALHGAAMNGHATMIELLLRSGLDPNTRVAGFTPAMYAAVRGNTQGLGVLVGAGAMVRVQQPDFGTTPLLWASTTGHVDTVRFLVEHGADVNAADVNGHTPLTWARRRGDTEITALLVSAGAKASSDSGIPRSAETANQLAVSSLRAAAERSLTLLQMTGRAFMSNGEGCVSCHHQSLPAMAVGLARKKGVRVDETVATEQRDAVLRQLDEQREDLLQGFGAVDVLDPAFFLTGLAAEGQKANRAIDAAVVYLLGRQQSNGSWKNVQYRPPLQQSDMINTALSINSLRCYALPGRKSEAREGVIGARKWLERHAAGHSTDEAWRLLGLRWSDASSTVIHNSVNKLIAAQREDGGWAQLPSLPSDAYATGIALVALFQSGSVEVNSDVYQRGVRFLASTQLNDGSWLVQKRSFPVQPYFETNFPHGESQFISAAATSWSTMAILLACEDQF